jgi:hypothetical protein
VWRVVERFTGNRRILIESGLAFAAALVAALLPYDPVRLWSRIPQGPYVALVACGLLVAAAVVGGLWGDRKLVGLLRRGAVVLALLALLAGTGILAVGWLLLGTGNTGSLNGPGGYGHAYPVARALTLALIWPTTLFVVWMLGSVALLARRRFASAVVDSASAFGALGIIYAIIEAPLDTPQFALVNLLTAPAWIDALLFLAVDALAVYLAWTRLFRSDFVQPAMRGAT